MSDRSLELVDEIIRGIVHAELRETQDFATYGFSLSYKGKRIDPADVEIVVPATTHVRLEIIDPLGTR